MNILGRASGTPEQALKWFSARADDSYLEPDHRSLKTIISAYQEIGELVGLDWFLALAQMGHETGNLRSFWSLRPRRNPAGIGCDGNPKAFEGDGKPGTFNPERQQWEHGISFETWANDSVPAHIGRLLAYALPIGMENPAQLKIILQALSYRAFPDKARGSAQTFVQLGKVHNKSGFGWASPGDKYGERIAAIAVQMRRNIVK